MSTVAQTATAAPAERDPAVEGWLAALSGDVSEAQAAVDNLLFGRVWLGRYAGGDVAVTVPQFLPVDRHGAFDAALQAWLAVQLEREELPEDDSAKGYAQALLDAFAVLQALDLPQTQAWCTAEVDRLWLWLKRQAVSASRDPRPAFLRALALAQADRRLLPFWARLCHQADERFAPLALFGLRRLPKNDQGEKEDAIPRALITHLLDYGKTLAKAENTHKKRWLEEVDFLSAVYPAPRTVWEKQFRLAHADRLPQTLRNWLDTRFPNATRPPESDNKQAPLEAPHWDNEIQSLLQTYDRQPTLNATALRALMDQHRRYAKETGDAGFLVRTFTRLGDFLLKHNREARQVRDPAWAFDLAEEAVDWAPTDPQSWALLAQALDILGDWRRARAVFWYARRRFPHNMHSHNQLGHALAMRGDVDIGEAVYRQAIRRFPNDPVCWTDLAHTLRVAGRYEEALAVYREAEALCRRDKVWAGGIAGVLIQLGRIAEARDALAWASEIADDDRRHQAVLADLTRRLAALERNEALPTKQPHPTPEHSTADVGAGFFRGGIDLLQQPHWGLTTLWRQQGDVARARAALEACSLHDPMRRVELGLLRVAELPAEGWQAARDEFGALARRHAGDATLQAHYQRARARCGDAADWEGLYRYPELSPLIRLEQGRTGLPAELQYPELDDEGEQARWLLLSGAAAGAALRDAIEDDFLSSRRMAA